MTKLGLNIKESEHVTRVGDGPLKGSTEPMIDLGTYAFKDLNTGKITHAEPVMSAYAEEVFESEHICTSPNKCVKY